MPGSNSQWVGACGQFMGEIFVPEQYAAQCFLECADVSALGLARRVAPGRKRRPGFAKLRRGEHVAAVQNWYALEGNDDAAQDFKFPRINPPVKLRCGVRRLVCALKGGDVSPHSKSKIVRHVQAVSFEIFHSLHKGRCGALSKPRGGTPFVIFRQIHHAM